MRTKQRLIRALFAAAWVATAFGALALAGCSDESVVAENTNILEAFDAHGEAYLCLNLMPLGSEGMTRASHQGSDVDGTEAENKIANATLMLFGGTSDTYYQDLKFKSAYKFTVGDGDKITSEGGDISQTYQKIIKIQSTDIQVTDNLYAYVVVNNNGNIQLRGDGSVLIKDVQRKVLEGGKYKMVAGNELIDNKTTYKDFRDLCFAVHPGLPGSFIMTNAPLLKLSGSTPVSVSELPQINTSYVYHSAALAKAGSPAVDVCVERIHAKLQLKLNVKDNGVAGNSKTDYHHSGYGELEENPYIWFDITSTSTTPIKWSTDNRALVAYNVRHTGLMKTKDVDGVSKDYEDIGMLSYNSATNTDANRFWEEATTGATGLHRIYWAVDPDYDYANPEDKAFTLYRGPATLYNNDQMDHAVDEVSYLAENTMNEYGLTQDKTTRIIIRVPFSAGLNASDQPVKDETFYTIPSNNRDYIYQDKDRSTVKPGWLSPIQDYIIEQVAEFSSKYMAWKAEYCAGKSHAEILKVTMLEGNGNNKYTATDNSQKDIGYGKCVAQFSVQDGAGVSEAGKEAFSKKTLDGDGNVTSGSVADELRELADKLNINCYVGGRVYYKVRIRHFPDSEVEKCVETGGSDYASVYPAAKRAQNYLGRYGLVRNTWYTVTIDGIQHIGVPDYEPYTPIPQIPDDELEDYINVRIRETKWSQREQHNTL